jgi:hypothetical protein
MVTCESRLLGKDSNATLTRVFDLNLGFFRKTVKSKRKVEILCMTFCFKISISIFYFLFRSVHTVTPLWCAAVAGKYRVVDVLVRLIFSIFS